MRLFFAVLYTGLVLGANVQAADYSAVEALRDGTMKKLAFSDPAEVSKVTFSDPDGGEYTLSDFKGRITLVNFWATWCAPCRKEMPMLSELQTALGGDDFQVATIATGRNSLPAMQKFFEEVGVDNLPLYLDPRQALAREMAVLGLPITVILDRDGREIARMRGDADWNSDSAKAIIATLIETH